MRRAAGVRHVDGELEGRVCAAEGRSFGGVGARTAEGGVGAGTSEGGVGGARRRGVTVAGQHDDDGEVGGGEAREE